MPRFKTRRIVASIQAIAAFAAGILITFSQSHGAAIGMVALAIVSVGWAIAFGWSAIVDKKSRGRVFRAIISVASVAMAVFAIQSFASLAGVSGQVPIEKEAWAWGLLESWGFAGALTEVILALFSKPGSIRRRDHLISAGLAGGLGLTQFFTPVDDAVTHVGFFGAYAVILAVHLGLSVLSPTAKASSKSASKKSGTAKSKSAGKKSADAKTKSKK